MTRSSLRDRILSAARSLFLSPGYHATNTRTLASTAGTSESGIFRLFASKYEVLMAVYDDSWRRVNERVQARLAASPCDDPRTAILQTLEELWHIYEADHVTASFLIINTGNTDSLVVDRKDKAVISPQNVAYIAHIQELTEACVRGRYVSRNLSAAVLREGLLGLSEGILLGWYLADHTDEDYPAKVSIDEAVVLVRQLLTPVDPANVTKRSVGAF